MDKVQLLNDISNSFDEAELKEICFRLQINYGHISGANLPDRARELILYLERRTRLPELVQVVVTLRPALRPAYAAYLAEHGLSATASPAPPSEPPPPAITTPPVIPAPDAPKINPFIAGPMVTQPEMFYGRRAELRRLQTRLRNRGSCSIVGMRRMGKSSLLYHLGHHTDLNNQPGYLVAHLDLQDGRYHTLPGLIHGAYEAWGPPANNVRLSTADLPGFSQSVSQLHAAGYRPVLCLDEFENLLKHAQEFTDTVFESWRALGNAGQLVFVTVSQQPLADLIQQSDLTSNFHNIFDQTTLALLAPDEARALVKEPAQRQGVPFREEDVAYLLDLCGPHPFYLQMAAFQLFDMMTVDGVDRAQLHDDFVWAAERHWQGMWRALTPAEQAAFPLVWEEATSPTVAHYRAQMARKGLLVKEGKGYKPFSRGFADWVRENRPPTPPPHTPPDATPTPEPDEKDKENQTPPIMDKGLLVLTGAVTLAVLAGVALVLRYILEVQSVGSLVLLLAILLPFILVIVGRLAGQDFLAWLQDLLGKK
ncbi:MAG TPA: hypothetical protein PLD25_22205 [Chloroflexota bacterium]|nr:hypothetical protein [Chloroflexota bacterium]